MRLIHPVYQNIWVGAGVIKKYRFVVMNLFPMNIFSLFFEIIKTWFISFIFDRYQHSLHNHDDTCPIRMGFIAFDRYVCKIRQVIRYLCKTRYVPITEKLNETTIKKAFMLLWRGRIFKNKILTSDRHITRPWAGEDGERSPTRNLEGECRHFTPAPTKCDSPQSNIYLTDDKGSRWKFLFLSPPAWSGVRGACCGTFVWIVVEYRGLKVGSLGLPSLDRTYM